VRPLSTFNNTLGSMAGPGDAHDTTTDEVGSAPQVRWTCSGVPLVLVGVGTGPMLVKRVNEPLLRTSAGASAAAKPLVPTAFRSYRRDGSSLVMGRSLALLD
jgi:hypothetical protein